MMTDWPRFFSDWAQYLATGIAGMMAAVWTLLGRRHSLVLSRLDLLADRVSQAERASSQIPDRCHAHLARLASIEDGLRTGPQHSDLNALREKHDVGMARVHDRVDRMEQSLGRIEGNLDAMQRTLHLIHTTMMQERSGA